MSTVFGACAYTTTPTDRQRVRDAVDAYNELLANGYGESTREVLSACGENHGGPCDAAQFPRLLRPLMVTESAYTNLQRTVRALAAALDIAVDRLAADGDLRRKIRIPEYLEPILAMDSVRSRSVIGRFDGFVDEDGIFKIIEYNADPAIHGCFEVNSAFASTPLASAFARQYRFSWSHVLDAAHDAVVHQHRRSGRRGTPVVAVVGCKGGIGEQSVWRWIAYVAARGCTVVAATAEQLEYRDGRLRVNGAVVDQVLLVSWRDVLVTPERLVNVMAAVRDGAVEIINGIARNLLAAYKSTLEILSDPQYRHWFPEDTWGALECCVPWTRTVGERRVEIEGRDVDLLQYVSQHKDRFVLKPSGLGRGNGVVLGWTVSAEQWNRVLERRSGSYVVQQRVVPSPDIYPVESEQGIAWRELVTDCCPYVWNGSRVAGCLARTTEAGHLQNVAAGGMRTALWILQDAA